MAAEPRAATQRGAAVQPARRTDAFRAISVAERSLSAERRQWIGLVVVALAAVTADQLTKHVVASSIRIDTAVKLGLRHPMGPFELIDYTGLDINLHVANIFFDEFKDPAVAPPALLKRMVLAGRLGTKVGRGFYEYDEKGQKKPSTPTKYSML